jgi:hypothetical protein
MLQSDAKQIDGLKHLILNRLTEGTVMRPRAARA